MRNRSFRLVGSVVFLGLVLVAEAASPQDLISSGESYALKKDQIGYYESILRKSVHTSRVDLVASVNVLAERAPETHVAGALLVRPFTTLPVLGSQIIRDSRLYRETERQTGHGLSPEAVSRVDSIVEEVRAFQNRPVWQRTVILMETAFTDQRLYHTVDYDDVRPR